MTSFWDKLESDNRTAHFWETHQYLPQKIKNALKGYEIKKR